MRRRTLLVLFVAALAAHPAAAPLHAQVTRTAQGTTLNFQDADLAYVLYALAQAAGVNYAANDLPSKPITMRTTTPLSQQQLLALIRNLAETNGVTVAEAGGVMRFQGSGQSPIEDPRQLFIHKLRHARAPVLAQTLQALFSGGISTPRPAGNTAQTLSAQLQQLQQQQQQRPATVVVSGGQIVNPFGVTIVPDEVTNSLLVRATPAEWQVMQQAIQGLDLRPLQVVLEVVIAEVRRQNDLNIGVSVSGTRVEGDRETVGTLPPPATRSASDFSIRYTRTGDIDIDATLSALASTGNVRILSRPVVQAQNNQEATISVGEERPFVAVSRPSGIPGQIGEDVVQYRQVSTRLVITPTINDDGYVNMAVTQDINKATNEVQFGAPVISSRNAVTQLLARDGQTVVIGGLIDRQTDRTRGGIPFLKDIPLLGALFGSTRSVDATAELFLFITPHIVTTDEDADRMKQEIERNADLLQPLVPIRPLITPVRPIRPDTIRPDTTRPDATLPPVRRDGSSGAR